MTRRNAAWPVMAVGAAAMAAGVLLAVPAVENLLGPRLIPNRGFGVLKAGILAAGFAVLAMGKRLHTVDDAVALSPWWNRWRDTWWREVGRFVVLVVELALFLAVVRTFAIESPAFTALVVPLVVIGFVVHHWTPSPYRPPMFLLLSICALVLVFGPSNAMWMLAIGAGLIALAHLPVAFAWRVTLIVVAGGALAALRAGADTTPFSRAVWPILGSMFMFRIIVYLYDLRHDTTKVGVSRRLGYFFLLPNVAFPLFPVVDWAAYRRTYYDADAFAIYQRGVYWMVRGVLQLLAYRVVYQFFMLSPDDVTNPAQLGQFILANFFLYVRVSGQFHLVVGMLHLFGFHLPETHKRYFLASSFTDFWRRINIYWKDFVMKVFYYPAYFRLRRRGERFALVIATLFVFAATWLLHSYQWFWLLGRFPLAGPDMLFWGILAGLLVFNSLRELRQGRTRSLRAPALSLATAVPRVLKTAGTFAMVCVLWSLWMSSSVQDWLTLWGSALRGTQGPRGVALALAVGATTVGIGAARDRGIRLPRLPKGFGWSCVATTSTLLVLLLGSRPDLVGRLGSMPGRWSQRLHQGGLNQQDLVRMQRGYYEDLMGVSRFNSQLWEIYMQRPPVEAWPMVWETPAGRTTGDYLRFELRPSAHINYLGAEFTTNRWGMRDREYALEKPPGTVRIALLGASIEMGWGVADGQTFEAFTEERLNREPPPGPKRRYEILNFAVAAYKLPQQVMILDRVFAFHPDIVLLAAHHITPRGAGGREMDARDAVDHMMERAKAGVASPFDTLRRFVAEAQVGAVPDALARRRLAAHADEIAGWAYSAIANACRRHGARPLLVFVPAPDGVTVADPEAVFRAPRAAGYQILDLSSAYAGQDLASLRLTTFDYHPNVRGNRLLADRLYQLLADSVLTPTFLARTGANTPGGSR